MEMEGEYTHLHGVTFSLCVLFCFGGHKKTNKLIFSWSSATTGGRGCAGGRRLGKYLELIISRIE